jgi:hypothetical protein
MQLMAVIDADEILFVDSLAYAVQGQEGGRLIRIGWRPQPPGERSSLGDPVGCELVFYHPDMEPVQQRLIAELARALRVLEDRYRDHALPAQGARVLPFQRSGRVK